jgi:hypothetical protein
MPVLPKKEKTLICFLYLYFSQTANFLIISMLIKSCYLVFNVLHCVSHEETLYTQK